MTSPSPRVSALSLNFRNPNAAVNCAKQLQEQSIIDEIEILIIDNHSEDDSVGVLRNSLSHLSNVRIIETPNNDGFGYGYNTGAKYAKGEYLLINNPDKVLEPEGVEKLVAKMESDPAIGILAPKLVHPDGTYRLSMRAFPRVIDILSRRSALGKLFPHRLKTYLMQDSDPEKEHDVDWVVGGCFMIRKDLFDSLGGFDERFFLFFEDTDLCRRCKNSGKRVVYYPLVTASDKKRRLSGERFSDLIFNKIGRIHIMSAFKYFGKWGIKEG